MAWPISRIQRLFGRLPDRPTEEPDGVAAGLSLSEEPHDVTTDLSPQFSDYVLIPPEEFRKILSEGAEDTEYMDLLPHNLPDPKVSLDKLKDWIDNPSPFAHNSSKTSPIYLFKPEFNLEILTEGLIYIVGKYKKLSSEFRALSYITMEQYNQDMRGWLEEYGLDEEPEGIVLREEIASVKWKDELRGAWLKEDELLKLPRTIVVMARLVKKMQDSNHDMKMGIGALQGDIEGVFEEDGSDTV